MEPSAHQSMFSDTHNFSVNETLQEDSSFNFKGKINTFDLTFSNLNSSDQSILIRMKEAFQLYLRKDEAEVKILIDEIFSLTSADKKIDLVCVEFSEKLIDDMPHQDPRWAEHGAKSKSFNSNLIITNQLKGKMRYHEYYLTFLKQYNIWEKVIKQINLKILIILTNKF